MKQPLKAIVLTIGIISLVLGLIGVFLPLLPTTPFLLLAGICFEKTSDRFHKLLMENKLLGPVVSDWKKYKRIRLRSKIMAISLLAISIYFLAQNQNIPSIGVLVISCFLVIVGIFIASRKQY